jgi:DNA-directed RNA polymerase specialized sigma54-like protein
MVHLKIKPTQTLHLRLKQKLIPRIKLAQFLSLPENEFAKLIKEIEDNPLFRKLTYPTDLKEKIFAYGRFPKTNLSSNFYELKEELLGERNFPEVESVINRKKEVLKICKKIGIDNFNKYFLYHEGTSSLEEIADECEIELEEVKKIIDLVNEIAIYSEFYEPTSINLQGQIHYTKIAKIEKDEEDFIVKYYSPHLARGRYLINYEKIEKLKREDFFTTEELANLKHLVKNMELVNLRKSILSQIIEKIIARQKRYLENGEPEEIQTYTQSELAREIATNPSVISRALRYRSIEIPTGEEVPLQRFFLKPKKKKMELVEKIIAEEGEISGTRRLSDETIKKILKEKYNLSLSRRTIAVYRQELKISSSFQRALVKSSANPKNTNITNTHE